MDDVLAELGGRMKIGCRGDVVGPPSERAMIGQLGPMAKPLVRRPAAPLDRFQVRMTLIALPWERSIDPTSATTTVALTPMLPLTL